MEFSFCLTFPIGKSKSQTKNRQGNLSRVENRKYDSQMVVTDTKNRPDKRKTTKPRKQSEKYKNSMSKVF